MREDNRPSAPNTSLHPIAYLHHTPPHRIAPVHTDITTCRLACRVDQHADICGWLSRYAYRPMQLCGCLSIYARGYRYMQVAIEVWLSTYGYRRIDSLAIDTP